MEEAKRTDFINSVEFLLVEIRRDLYFLFGQDPLPVELAEPIGDLVRTSRLFRNIVVPIANEAPLGTDIGKCFAREMELSEGLFKEFEVHMELFQRTLASVH